MKKIPVNQPTIKYYLIKDTKTQTYEHVTFRGEVVPVRASYAAWYFKNSDLGTTSHEHRSHQEVNEEEIQLINTANLKKLRRMKPFKLVK